MDFFRLCRMYIMHFKDKERTVKLDSSEEYYYVIRFNKKEGLLSMFFKTMALIEYAEKKGYIPYIDMKKFPSMYTDSNSINAWEYFFTQIKGVTETMVYNRNHIISGWQRGGGYKQFHDAKLFGPYFAKNYLRNKEKKEFIFSHVDFSEQIDKMLNEEYAELPNLNNMLGVYIRGTDYIAKKPSGHPIQPSVEDIMIKCDEFINKYSEIKGVYLVTEDINYYKKLKERYGEKLYISYRDNFVDQYDYKSEKLLYQVYDKNDVKKTGQEYLCKIILLSKCGYLVSSLTNGSVCALAFNGDEYKDKFIFDLGLYS